MSETPNECPIKDICAYLEDPNKSMDLDEDGQEGLYADFESSFTSPAKNRQIEACQKLLKGACLYTEENKDELMTYFINEGTRF